MKLQINIYLLPETINYLRIILGKMSSESVYFKVQNVERNVIEE